MGASRLAVNVIGFAVLVALIFGSCAVVPGPATSRVLEVPPPVDDRLRPGDRLVIIGNDPARDTDSTVSCVSAALVGKRPTVRVVPAKEYRALLAGFPDLSGVVSSEEMEGARQASVQLRVRYVVRVGSMLTYESNEMKGPVIVGAMWGDRNSRVGAEIWDLTRPARLGTVEVGASGKNVGVGAVPGCGLFTVLSIPMTETTACNALGRQLAELLADDT